MTLGAMKLRADPRSLITRELEDGIRTFQQKNGLKNDGVVNPGGPTLATLRTRLFGDAGPEKAKSGAGEKTPEAATRQRQGGNHKLEKATEWEQVKPIADSGATVIKARGPVRISRITNALSLDGIHYTVQWQPLDKNGKIVPEFRRPDHRAKPGGGLVTIRKSRDETFQPPYHNPYGFRITISIPPQQAVSGNSKGAYLQISVPKGDKLD